MIERERRRPNIVEFSNGNQERVETAQRKNRILTLINGDPEELEAIQRHVKTGHLSYEEAAPRFRELIEQNPEWAYLFERYSQSPKHFAELLVELYRDRFSSYSSIYRMTASINLGEGRQRTYVVKPPTMIEPPSIAKDPTRKLIYIDIVTDAEITTRFIDFSKTPQRVLGELEEAMEREISPLQREIYEKALRHFEEVINLRVAAFRDEFQPRLYQSEAILKGANGDTTSIAVFDEMRTGKTLIDLARIEHLGAKKALIVVPAGVKRHWQEKINEYYINPPKSVIIESSRKDRLLEEAANPDTKFVIVSYDLLLGRNSKDSNKEQDRYKLVNCLRLLGFDCLTLDEVQYAKNFRNKTDRSDAILKLVDMPSLKHRILLSGTPVDKVRDMEFIAHLLDPKAYPAPASFWEHSRGKPNPRTGRNELLSRVIRRTAKEVLKLPPYTADTQPVTLTPTQRVLYDFILEDESTNRLAKLSKLRAVVLQPRLVHGIKVPFKESDALIKLSGAFNKWYRQHLRNPETIFDTDFLVTNGFTDLYISSHFNLGGGICELVKKSQTPLIQEAWKGETVPAKFSEIKTLAEKALKNGEKVIVYTSYFANGVTRDLESEISEKEHVKSLLKFLQEEFGADAVLKIDGRDDTESTLVLSNGDKTSKREKIRKEWQNNQQKRILLCNRASSLGIDLSISDPRVSGVTMIFEGLPLSLPEFLQGRARILSDTQKSPVKMLFLEAKNTLDRDLYFILMEKEILAGILLDGGEFTPEEIKIFEDSMEERDEGYLTKMIRSPRENVTNIFNVMMRQKVEDNVGLLAKKFTPSQTYGEYLAQWYDGVYAEGYAKYTTEVVKQVIRGLERRAGLSGLRIADWGSGPLILSRKLRRPVYSLDLSSEMLSAGKQKIQEEGVYIPDNYVHQGSITDMPKDVFKDESIDIGVCSLALDCISPHEDRLKALKEMHRSLAPNGYLIFTIPESELGAWEFYEFKEGLKILGFTDDLNLSGLVRGKTNENVVFNTWIFVVKKERLGLENIDSRKFTFIFEKDQDASKKKEERRLQGLVRRRLQKTPFIEKFSICVPDKTKSSSHWVEKGGLNELLEDSLLRYLLDLPDEALASYGYKRETTIRDGKQEIRLTRL